MSAFRHSFARVFKRLALVVLLAPLLGGWTAGNICLPNGGEWLGNWDRDLSLGYSGPAIKYERVVVQWRQFCPADNDANFTFDKYDLMQLVGLPPWWHVETPQIVKRLYDRMGNDYLYGEQAFYDKGKIVYREYAHLYKTSDPNLKLLVMQAGPRDGPFTVSWAYYRKQ